MGWISDILLHGLVSCMGAHQGVGRKHIDGVVPHSEFEGDLQCFTLCFALRYTNFLVSQPHFSRSLS